MRSEYSNGVSVSRDHDRPTHTDCCDDLPAITRTGSVIAGNDYTDPYQSSYDRRYVPVASIAT